jgi:hypothetical protein
MSTINWSIIGKTVALAINLDAIARLHYTDGTVDTANNIVSFPRGIYCNPKLEKKQYLTLLRIYHPDVCTEIDNKTATEIAQVINAAKDGQVTFNYSSSASYEDIFEYLRRRRQEAQEQWRQQERARSQSITIDDAIGRLDDQYKYLISRFGRTGYTKDDLGAFVKEVWDAGLLIRIRLYESHNGYSAIAHIIRINQDVNHQVLRLSEFKAKELKAICKALGIKSTGIKEALIELIKTAPKVSYEWSVEVFILGIPMTGYDARRDEMLRHHEERMKYRQFLESEECVELREVIKKWIPLDQFKEVYKRCIRKLEDLNIKLRSKTNLYTGQEYYVFPKSLASKVWLEFKQEFNLDS